MRAAELMLGDYVLYNTYPEKVYSIGHKTVQLYHSNERVSAEDLSPISLTAEVLEKNGIRYTIGPSGLFQIAVEGCCTYISFNVIYYVHELQHALRLCGIEKEVVL